MENYIAFVKANQIVSAIIQFAILGTLGEFISRWVTTKKMYNPFSFKQIIWKMIVWSILAICIKYAFMGFKGYIDILALNGFLPKASLIKGSLTRAFAISFFVNIQFGLFLVIFHRVLDNLIETKKNWANLDKAIYSLFWFWIPAHTFTFFLPTDIQIGMAALWSLALGLILGLYNRA